MSREGFDDMYGGTKLAVCDISLTSAFSCFEGDLYGFTSSIKEELQLTFDVVD